MRQGARLAAWGIAALLWMGAGNARAQEPAPAAGAFDAEAATEAYLARMPPEARERSDAYFEGGYWLQLWGFLYGLGVSWIFLGTGLSVRMRDRAERVTRFNSSIPSSTRPSTSWGWRSSPSPGPFTRISSASTNTGSPPRPSAPG